MAVPLAKIAAKVSVAGGVLYWSIQQGVWGTSEEGSEAGKRFNNTIVKPASKYVKESPYLIDVNTTAKTYWNSGVSSFFTKLSHMPDVGDVFKEKATLTMKDWNKALFLDPKSTREENSSDKDIKNERTLRHKLFSTKITDQEQPLDIKANSLRRTQSHSPDTKATRDLTGVAFDSPRSGVTALPRRSPEIKLSQNVASVESAILKGRDKNVPRNSSDIKPAPNVTSAKSIMLKSREKSAPIKSSEMNLKRSMTNIESTYPFIKDTYLPSQKSPGKNLSRNNTISPNGQNKHLGRPNSFKILTTPSNLISLEPIMCCPLTSPDKVNKTQANSKSQTPSEYKRSNTFEPAVISGHNYVTSLVSPPKSFIKLPKTMLAQSADKSTQPTNCVGTYLEKFSAPQEICVTNGCGRIETVRLIKEGSPVLLSQFPNSQVERATIMNMPRSITINNLLNTDDNYSLTNPISPESFCMPGIPPAIVTEELGCNPNSPTPARFGKQNMETSPPRKPQLLSAYTTSKHVSPVLVSNLRPSAKINKHVSPVLVSNLRPSATINKLVSPVLVENLRPSATINKLVSPVLVENLRPSATINKLVSSVLVENLQPSDTINNLVSSVLISNLHPSDTINNLVSSVLISNLHPSDTINNLVSSVLVENLQPSDTINNLVSSVLISNLQPSAKMNKPRSLKTTIDSQTCETSISPVQRSTSFHQEVAGDHNPSVSPPATTTSTTSASELIKSAGFPIDTPSRHQLNPSDQIFYLNKSSQKLTSDSLLTPATFQKTSLVNTLSPQKSETSNNQPIPTTTDINQTSPLLKSSLGNNLIPPNSTSAQTSPIYMKSPVNSALTSIDNFLGTVNIQQSKLIHDNLIFVKPLMKPTAYVTGGLISLISPPKSAYVPNQFSIRPQYSPVTAFMNGGFSALTSQRKSANIRKTPVLSKSSTKLTAAYSSTSLGNRPSPSRSSSTYNQNQSLITPNQLTPKPVMNDSHINQIIPQKSFTILNQNQSVITHMIATDLLLSNGSVNQLASPPKSATILSEVKSTKSPVKPNTLYGHGGLRSTLAPATPTFIKPSLNKHWGRA